MDYSKKYKDVALKPLKIYIIQAVPFILLIRKRGHEIFAIIIKNIKKVLKLKQYINP